jgi:hypothetical protein
MSSNMTNVVRGRERVARRLLGIGRQFLPTGLTNVVRDQQIEHLARKLGGSNGVQCREHIGSGGEPASSRPLGQQAQALSRVPEKAMAPIPRRIVSPVSEKAACPVPEKALSEFAEEATPSVSEKTISPARETADLSTPDGSAATTPANAGQSSQNGSNPVDETPASILLRLVREARIFRGLDRQFYADVPWDGHHEVHELGSAAFEYWLIRRFRQVRQSVPSLEGLKRIIRALEADAMALGTLEPVTVRVAAGPPPTTHEVGELAVSRLVVSGTDLVANGVFSPLTTDSKENRWTEPPPTTHHSPLTTHRTAYYIDLGDPSWDAVEIRADGWRVVARPTVAFRRPSGLLPFPRPVPSDFPLIELLRKYLNVSEADLPLVIAWVTAAFRPVGPYAVLVLSGEQGSAKSTMARVLCRLIDPSTAALRGLPTNLRDLMIEAHNGWLLAYDNVSSISAPTSDALCRIATGGGYSTRALFKDRENTLIDVVRPILIATIEEIIRRSDLIDRSVHIHLLAIADELRRVEQTLFEEFEADYPKLLGGVFDAVSAGMRNWDTFALPALPRMADFAHWGEAVCRGLGYEPGVFLARYMANRREACSSALDDCPVASAVQDLFNYVKRPTEKTASELLSVLAEIAPRPIRQSAQWPKNGRALSVVLRRIAPQLRIIGIDVKFGLGRYGRVISIARNATAGEVPGADADRNQQWTRFGSNA